MPAIIKRGTESGAAAQAGHAGRGARIRRRQRCGLDIADFGSPRTSASLRLRSEQRTSRRSSCVESLKRLMRDDPHNYLNLAADYAGSGPVRGSDRGARMRLRQDEAAEAYPMLHYALGYCTSWQAFGTGGQAPQSGPAKRQPDYCFPNSLFDLLVLESAARRRRNGRQSPLLSRQLDV